MPGKPRKRHPVTQPIDKPFRYIPLTQGQNAMVDAYDFEWLSQWNWCACWSPSTKSFYARRGLPTIHMHRVILGCKRGEFVDHINHNTLDNRRQNLRRCGHRANSHNRGLRSDNSTGFKGVYLRRSGRWQGQFTLNGKRISLGYFNTAREAAQAYNSAAMVHHGEFARLNEFAD